MTLPTYTPPPAAGPPLSTDRANFAARADDWNSWIAAFFPQLVTGTGWMDDQVTAVNAAVITVNAAAAGAIAAGIYVATSTTARSAQAGSQTHPLVETSRGFLTGDRVVAIRRGAPDTRKRGNVTGYASNTLTVTWDDVPAGAPATTYADWLFMLAGLEAGAPVTAADILAGVKTTGSVTPDAYADTREPVVVTTGGVYAPNLGVSAIYDITLNANLNLSFLTNIGRAGQPFVLRIHQPASGGPYTLVHNAGYRVPGLPAMTLSTAANACDEISGYVLTGKTAASCSFRKNV